MTVQVRVESVQESSGDAFTEMALLFGRILSQTNASMEDKHRFTQIHRFIQILCEPHDPERLNEMFNRAGEEVDEVTRKMKDQIRDALANFIQKADLKSDMDH